MELVPLQLGSAIYESGSHQGHVYFPTDSIVSLLFVMEDGSSAEIAVAGNEGVTEAAGKLQTDGLIHYSRGKITVLDRRKLEARVCECQVALDSLELEKRHQIIVALAATGSTYPDAGL